MAKRTSLYDIHTKYGGKMVEFAGYELPIQYETGLIKEHTATRTAAGIFDVSHMGELIVSGENAERELNKLLSNDIAGMYDGQVRYAILPNERGGAIDDVLVYRFGAQKFMLVVNASNLQKDAAWIKSKLACDTKFDDVSSSISQIAIQGPHSYSILAKVASEQHIPKKYYSFIEGALIDGRSCLISQTGYTGEHGYEIYCDNQGAPQIFEALMTAGEKFGLIPCGLGARDTLRLEAGMPLYGHEMTEDYPINELGLDFAIKMTKDDFIGKTALQNHTPAYERVNAKVAERGIAREQCPVFSGDEQVGIVTSGTHSPTLGQAIAVLRLIKGYQEKPLQTEVRGKRLKLEVVGEFYRRK